MRKATLTTVLLLYCTLLLCLFGISQTRKIEQLKQKLVTENTSAGKLETLLRLCAESGSLNPDTLQYYANNAKTLAIGTHDQLKTTLAEYYIALHLQITGAKDSCIKIVDEQLRQLQYNGEQASVYVNYSLLKARVFNNVNKTKEALDLLYPILVEAEKKEDTLTQIKVINTMELVFVTMGDNQEARKWCMKALQLFPRISAAAYREPYGVTLSNCGITCLHLYENGDKSLLDSAQYYTDKSIAVCRENESLGGVAYSLGLKGTMLGFQNKKKEGEQMLLESLATYRQIGNIYYIINAMSVLGNFYGITNQPQKGIAICKEGIELSKKYQFNIYLYQNLAGNYKLAGDYKNYGQTMEELSFIKDSLHQKNSAQALQEAQRKYEMQKKENTIIQQQYAITKKNYLAYGSLLLLALGAVFTFILLKENRKKQQLKLAFVQEEEKRRSEIAVIQAEEKERKRIAAELHDNLGGQLSYISSNMDFILEAPAGMTEQQKTDHLSKVNDTAKSTIADLRESIWALKKQQVDMEELADKLKLYMQHQLSHRTSIRLQIQEDIQRKSIISSAEALNIFRIFQEAINNTIKYAGASAIVVFIQTTPAVLYKISLHDNGKGFNPDAGYADHYGLENMRERAKEIKASIDIHSRSGEGTTVVLEKRQVYNANEVLPV